ncbi:CsgG/HfaB family protein [Aquibaculum arenosum]|uniref:CsgG/HfaB family protein n=1 Tax=Aquibaculum arenosum TaxID=3032591 RepID=A0ABT5YLU8_9PROT|nr:CsgG/HfaB family protein [Fodinicurvata sp. CAU 1616]MDF2095832.1 CsgG/HfaB family protein [Fodinicurvata sp. CAU 1616]
MGLNRIVIGLGLSLALAGCQTAAVVAEGKAPAVRPAYSFPVTTNTTPYTRCLQTLASYPGSHLPSFAVGEVSDKTGQMDTLTESTVLTQGLSEMVMSALWRSGKVRMVERYDLRIPLAELKMIEQGLTSRSANELQQSVPASDFVVLGALTELNYNIVSEGAGLWVGGIGAGGRTVIINVGLDLRLVNGRTFEVVHVSTLQKQVFGYEVEANVFRFFGSQLVEFDAGRIQNEPLQLGVRSVIEMAVYQIMTDYFRLPSEEHCQVRETNFFEETLTGKTKEMES